MKLEGCVDLALEKLAPNLTGHCKKVAGPASHERVPPPTELSRDVATPHDGRSKNWPGQHECRKVGSAPFLDMVVPVVQTDQFSYPPMSTPRALARSTMTSP